MQWPLYRNLLDNTSSLSFVSTYQRRKGWHWKQHPPTLHALASVALQVILDHGWSAPEMGGPTHSLETRPTQRSPWRQSGLFVVGRVGWHRLLQCSNLPQMPGLSSPEAVWVKPRTRWLDSEENEKHMQMCSNHFLNCGMTSASRKLCGNLIVLLVNR